MEIGGHLHVPVTLLQGKEHQLYHHHTNVPNYFPYAQTFFRRLLFAVSKKFMVFSETHTVYVT